MASGYRGDWKSETGGKAQKCALVITGEECDRTGDLALVDMDSGAYLWSIDTSYLWPTARVLQVEQGVSLRQQATFHGLWWTSSDAPPEGHPLPSLEKALTYIHESQDE